ncbi:MAG TPA: hypothetical protein VIM79_27555 [Niastella sp.]
MFIPQMAEADVYDAGGQQVDDINTLVEFIDQEVMGHNDSSPEDEDDDSGNPYHIIKMVDYTWHPYVAEIQTKPTVTDQPVKSFTGYIEHELMPGFSNIVIPPPKAA